jgi:uncharacterized membrane protein
MDEQPTQQVPPQQTGTSWQQTPPPPPNYQAAASPAEGLSDTAAGALAYITIIPAIIFLVMAPYNTKPFVRFHAFQSIGLFVLWFCAGFVIWIPFLGWAVGLALLVCWVLCILKASQGSRLKLPVISDFAAKQSGYQP